ncbi:twin-arginine translocation signal domain-containing protein [Acidobacteria bacterium AH-259-D05]|nr:twin-arginine translocation signal domain-containing protein [Acidobacteria bacterium AH-259-D05]
MKKKDVSRRDFLKTTGMGAAAIPAVAGISSQQVQAAPTVDRSAVIAALGDTIIPSEPGDPGYRALEPYNITAEVMKGLTGLSDDNLAVFNSSAASFFSGKTFLELSESERADYLNLIIDGSKIADQQLRGKLQSVYRLTRIRVLVVYYQNYPEHRLPRDANDVPILPPGDAHQITNPNTKRLVTGWDVAGFRGPLTWEEEERRRAYYKKIDWKE